MNWNDFKEICQESDKILKTQYFLHQSKDFTDKTKSESKINKNIYSINDCIKISSVEDSSNVTENNINNERIEPSALRNAKETKEFVNVVNCVQEAELDAIKKILDNVSNKTVNIDKQENNLNTQNHINVICKIDVTDSDYPLKQTTTLEWNTEESEDLKKYLLLLEREDLITSFESKLKTLKNTAYTCDICLKEYNDLIEYLDHQYIHEGELVFKCDRCSKVFASKKELKMHELKHQVACSQCKKMILMSSMKAHLISHTDKYRCSTCTLCFATRANLTTHIISTHTNIKEHVCETCGKRFSTKTSLTSHHKTHSDVRAYRCAFCSYAGRTASALYIHKSKHENASYVCETCPKTFKSTRCLKDHKRRVHNKNKRYECSYCCRRFVEKYMLTVHLRTHTGARPYECKVCLCTFVRSDGLKEHMGTHGERPNYNCKKCGKNFIYRRSLTRHNCLQTL